MPNVCILCIPSLYPGPLVMRQVSFQKAQVGECCTKDRLSRLVTCPKKPAPWSQAVQNQPFLAVTWFSALFPDMLGGASKVVALQRKTQEFVVLGSRILRVKRELGLKMGVSS